MTSGQDAPLTHILTTAEDILSKHWGTTIHLTNPLSLQASGRSYIYRCTLFDGPAEAPASVIIKAMRVWEGLKNEDEARNLLYNDWAGLQFLNEIAPHADLTPHFYAGDIPSALIIMEDLGTAPGMHDLLLGSDPDPASDALVRYSAMLGKMHAISIGKQEHFQRLRGGPGFDAHADSWHAHSLLEAIKELNIEPVPSLTRELGQLDAIIHQPGPFLTYTHGDPCPDNVLVTPNIKLYDFEFGMYRHALIEGVYPRIHFPSCWCVNALPSPLIQRMEQAYRIELVLSCPEAKDDTLFAQAVTVGCLYWVILHCNMQLSRLSQKDSAPDGRASGRQRLLARLAITARATEESGYMEATGHMLKTLASRLQSLWPPEAHRMEHYPAFR